MFCWSLDEPDELDGDELDGLLEELGGLLWQPPVMDTADIIASSKPAMKYLGVLMSLLLVYVPAGMAGLSGPHLELTVADNQESAMGMPDFIIPFGNKEMRELGTESAARFIE